MTELVARFAKRYRTGATVDVDFAQPVDGFSVLVLFGPSGSGKTTILRCLAGLETPQRGTIRFGDDIWFDSERNVNWPPQRRGVGYLFQQYALFPHLTVRQNVLYGAGATRNQDADRLADLLERFELGGLEERLPRQLSGGQQQRVALARTLFSRPRLLLLDEPLSALDQQLREEVRSQLRGWLSASAAPAVMVSHDRVDALALGDNVAVLADGRLLQHGTIERVFSNPASEDVARIIGIETIIAGDVQERSGELVRLNVQGVDVWATARGATATRMCALIRGEDVIVSRETMAGSSVRNQLQGTIVAVTQEGPLVRLVIDCGFRITALITRPAWLGLGMQVGDRGFALVKASAISAVDR